MCRSLFRRMVEPSSMSRKWTRIHCSTFAGSTVTVGDGVIKEMAISVVGTNPAGFDRTITIPLCTAVGTVGQSYKKGEKTMVPVRFEALKGASAGMTIVDSVA